MSVTDENATDPAEALDPDREAARQRKTLRGVRAQNCGKITADIHREVARVYRENIRS